MPEVRPRQGRAEQDNPLPAPASYAVLNAPQGTLSLLAARTHCWLMLSLLCHPQVPFCRAALQPLPVYLCPALLHLRYRTPHLTLLNFIPLMTALCSFCLDHSASHLVPPQEANSLFSIISKNLKNTFKFCIHIIDKNVEHNLP